MKIIPISDAGIKEACSLLQKGGIIVFPSDTVYGLLCDASNTRAVMKLYQIKNRPVGKPISVFVMDFTMMKKVVDVSDSQKKILESLLPGPYTIVLPTKKVLCSLLESEKGRLGVRIPSYRPVIDLLKLFCHPVTATSANTSSHAPFYSIPSFLKSLPHKKRKLIDLVVDGGELPKNKPSTVLDFSTNQVQTLRQGDLYFNNTRTQKTLSEEETKKIAETLLEEALRKESDKPVVFILKGEMGVGKTIFTKGLGNKLGINNIISPTFVIYYEYKTNHPLINTFIHCDLYNIEEEDEFKHLGLEKYFNKGTVLCFEWGEKSGALLRQFQKKAHIIVVSFTHQKKNKRMLRIEQNSK